MKGKWAQGIPPRNFTWVIRDRLAVCERPGGYGENHRKVRRQEEIIWIREQGLGPVISLIPTPHNLHAYDELGVTWEHLPFAASDDPHVVLPKLYERLRQCSAEGRKVLVHQEELGDRVAGAVAGYLVWTGLVPEPPRAVAMVEKLLERSLGPAARELVGVAAALPDRHQPDG